MRANVATMSTLNFACVTTAHHANLGLISPNLLQNSLDLRLIWQIFGLKIQLKSPWGDFFRKQKGSTYLQQNPWRHTYFISLEPVVIYKSTYVPHQSKYVLVPLEHHTTVTLLNYYTTLITLKTHYLLLSTDWWDAMHSAARTSCLRRR